MALSRRTALCNCRSEASAQPALRGGLLRFKTLTLPNLSDKSQPRLQKSRESSPDATSRDSHWTRFAWKARFPFFKPNAQQLAAKITVESAAAQPDRGCVRPMGRLWSARLS